MGRETIPAIFFIFPYGGIQIYYFLNQLERWPWIYSGYLNEYLLIVIRDGTPTGCGILQQEEAEKPGSI